MHIRMRADNRIFEGSPLEIVRQMRDISGEQAIPLVQYMHLLTVRAHRLALVSIDLPTETSPEACAEALLAGMLVNGLASEETT